MKYIFILVLLFSTGCSSLMFWQSDESDMPSKVQKGKEKKALEMFSRANLLFDKGKYKESKNMYLKVLRESPSTSIETMVLFNLAMSYESLGECKKAGKNFRKVVRSAASNQKRLQAQALYHLSKAYECVGNETKVISTLLDLKKRTQWLSVEVAYAEVPARLAGAYARRGNIELAEEYFKKAEKGLSRVGSIRMKEKDKRTILAKTLFMMGSIGSKNLSIADQEKGLKSLEYAQRYLLKSVEIDHKVWSPRSAEAILKAYEDIWVKVNEKSKSSLPNKADAFEDVEKRVELVKSVLTSMEILKRARFPESINQELVKVLFEQLEKKKVMFQGYLTKHTGWTQRTNEDKERFGIKRKVKLKEVK